MASAISKPSPPGKADAIPYRGPMSIIDAATILMDDYRDDRSKPVKKEWLRDVADTIKKLIAFGVKLTDDLDDAFVREFPVLLEKDKPNGQANTRAARCTALKTMCTRWFKLGVLRTQLEFPPIPRIETFAKKGPPLSEDDVRLYRTYLRNRTATFENRRFYVWVEIALWMGLRRAEVQGLRWEHIGTGPGKIRIPAKLKPLLEEWHDYLGPSCPFVIPGKTMVGPWKGGGGKHISRELQETARAAGIEGFVGFASLRRFFEEFSEPSVPCLDDPVPYGPGRAEVAPPHKLSPDDVTKLMAYLRANSASFEGHRLYLSTGLMVLTGLVPEDLREVRINDVDIDRCMLQVPGRLPTVLDHQAAEILKPWARRANQGDSPFLLPDDRRTGQWLKHATGSRNATAPLRRQLAAAAAAAGIPGTVTPRSLRRFWEACDGRVELGEAWRNTPQPRPILTEMKSPNSALKPQDERARRSTRATRATWSKDFRPAIEIGDPGDRLVVRHKDKGDLPKSWRKVINLLLDAFPGGLSGREMDERYGNRGWRAIIPEMRKDADFDRAIIGPPPGRPAGESDDLLRIAPL